MRSRALRNSKAIQEIDGRLGWRWQAPGANPGGRLAGHPCKSSFLSWLQRINRCLAFDCSRFCSCQILQIQHSSVSRSGKCSSKLLILLVGERGFEPPTPWSRTRCSTRLSHSPTLSLSLADSGSKTRCKPECEAEEGFSPARRSSRSNVEREAVDQTPRHS
jgi:hypothetical protein